MRPARARVIQEDRRNGLKRRDKKKTPDGIIDNINIKYLVIFHHFKDVHSDTFRGQITARKSAGF